MAEKTKHSRGLLRAVADYGPLIAFFVTYKGFGLLAATAVLVMATIIAVALVYSMDRKIAFFPLVSAAIVSVFGGLTLFFDDDRFIKLKPTIVSGIFSALFLYAWLRSKEWLKIVMGQAIHLKPEGWRRLTLRWSFLFLGLAVANELIWRTQTTETWVSFKVFGITGAVLVFSLLQLPLIQRYQLPEEEEKA